MRDLAKGFLTKQEQDELIRCVKEVEKTTSGEIVPVVVSASYHYPSASHLFGLAASIPLALLVSYIMGHTDMWTFATAFLVLYGLGFMAANVFPQLKRLFISPRAMEEEVHEAAMVNFHTLGLHRTRDMTGIIIFVSVFERKVWILADKGINDKVNPEIWKTVASALSQGIREGKPGESLCQAVKSCGEIVVERFPVKADDTDELPNLVIEGREKS